jgi:NAD-dependent dihydropyrimidine dehydrogenase PreA subunit
MEMRYLRNTVSLAIDTGRCSGCGMCVSVCPHDVFMVEAGKARIRDRDACMECGACRVNCPREAISVEAGTGGVMPVVEEMLEKRRRR